MKTIQKYVTRSLFWNTALALAVLVALFSFFSLIDQLEETGKGSYGVVQAVTYVFLTTPRLAYELFPIAAVIGSMAMLGILAQNSELDVIRTSGVSRLQLAGIMAKAGLLIVVIAIVVGELVAPLSEERAQHLRSVAMTKQITLKTKYGFWARDGNSFVNIRTILPGNNIEDIYIYEFDDEKRLRSSTFASKASYDGKRWLLRNIRQTTFDGESLQRRQLPLAEWESLLDPEMVNLLVVKPQYLPVWGLFSYIHFLEANAQNTLQYELALWSKLTRPVAIIAMILLAVPLVRGHSRFTAIGQRVFLGTLIGVTFYIINQASGQIGIVYQIPAAISATAPTVALLCILVWLLRSGYSETNAA